MKKYILVGQKNNELNDIKMFNLKQPSLKETKYGCSVSESIDKSEGKMKALAVGCNANNGNASARTANCNNASSNSNINYAGAFAVKQVGNINKSLTSQPTRLNITDNHIAIGGYGQGDYSLLPFWSEDNVESTAYATQEGILKELSEANKKRKLKNLKRFITNPLIVRMGVERCLSRASNSPEVRKAKKNKEAIINRIIEELSDETYRCKTPIRRVIVKKGKGDKNRNADIYSIYDRCVQNIILLVVREKLTNKIPRWCYSGIKGRSLWSNNKTYCMINQIRTFVKRHPNASVGLTDIRHFYESLKSNIVLGVLFKTIVCPYTRKLLLDILQKTDTLVIGGTLSQLFAMLVLSDMDNELINRFHPKFYGSFGDNRIIMDNDRRKVANAVHWELSYLEGRYGMHMKNDWQILYVKNGFRFCKQDFNGSFVNVRSELRRRAIRGAIRGKQHYAGYHGMLLKTDSKRLIYLIKIHLKELRMRNQKGMEVKPMAGDLVKLNKVDGKEIYITDYLTRKNNKDSEYFIRFQFVAIEVDHNGVQRKHLYVANNGSYEIKEFFKLVKAGEITLPVKTKICSEGTSFYFEQFHTTNQEACDLICKQLGI